MNIVKCLDICEKLEWEVIETYSDYQYELSKYSPAGEDYSFGVSAKDAHAFVERVKEEAAYFDPEDHVYDMLNAKRNGLEGVPGLFELVDDAKAIDEMLRDLACALQKAEDEEGVK